MERLGTLNFAITFLNNHYDYRQNGTAYESL